MNIAPRFVPGTRNPADGFQTIPVGAAGVGFGGLFGSTGWQEAGATPFPGNGIETCSPTLLPSPAYRVEQPVTLSLTQKGLPPGLKAMPQAFCNTGSRCAAAP